MKIEPKTIESAPTAAQPFLKGAQNAFGFVPNLLGTFAHAPATLEGYMGLSAAFGKTSFSPTEQQVVALTASVDNECTYCVAAHTTIGQMQKIDAAVLSALRANQALPDAKLEALRQFTKALLNKRGWTSEADREAFFEAGYRPEQALEVVLGVAMKILSNYTNHLAEPPLDAAFQANAWSPAGASV